MKLKICLASAAFVLAAAGAILAVISHKKRCARKCCGNG